MSMTWLCSSLFTLQCCWLLCKAERNHVTLILQMFRGGVQHREMFFHLVFIESTRAATERRLLTASYRHLLYKLVTPLCLFFHNTRKLTLSPSFTTSKKTQTAHLMAFLPFASVLPLCLQHTSLRRSGTAGKQSGRNWAPF